ncbi:MAG TPA: pyridoxal phosphate-dependent aminotransferase [Chitinophagaceae bacterium]|nr:pyridoxal phosphate-dependent aminotransferase [Chitinophagaceae bacterium]
MPTISNRGLKMPSSPIRKLNPLADAAKKRGTKVYHLNIGQPDIATPKSAMDAVRTSSFETLSYSPSAGIESYRNKLSKYYAKNDISVSPSQIIVTVGGSEAISFGFMSCLDPGDEVLIPEPFYANYNGFATTTQVTVKPVTSSIENNYALPDFAQFEENIGPKTQAILICNPSNPTGYLYSKEELEQLKDLCKKHDLFLFADEAYREFCYIGEHFSALQLEDMDEHVILMDTISKRYSACGARIGALVTRNEQILEIALKFAQARLSPPTFAQILEEAAVDLPETYFTKMQAKYKSRRDLLVSELQAMDGVECPLPLGAFYAMAKLPVDDSEKFCQWLLNDFSFDGATVMLAPATGFYATPGLGKQEVRLAYVLNEEEIKKAMTCLKEALKQYPDKL